MCSILKLETDKLKQEDMDELYSVHKKTTEKYKLLNRFKNAEDYGKRYLGSFDGKENEIFVLKNDQAVCGILNCIKSADWGGKEQYQLTLATNLDEVNQEIIDLIDELCQEKIKKHGKLAVVIYNDEFDGVLERHKSKVNLKGNYYTLKKEAIKIDILNDTIKSCSEKNKDLNIRYTDGIPEEYIEQYCNLFVETSKDMPDENEEGFVPYIITPEKQRALNEANKKRNMTHNCFMIFNSENQMIAKSNVAVNNNDPRFPYQFMIGVKKEYRGRNLGRWLYASMYKKLFEEVDFEEVLVAHHPDNKHAINISGWIGYQFNYLETIHILYNE